MPSVYSGPKTKNKLPHNELTGIQLGPNILNTLGNKDPNSDARPDNKYTSSVSPTASMSLRMCTKPSQIYIFCFSKFHTRDQGTYQRIFLKTATTHYRTRAHYHSHADFQESLTYQTQYLRRKQNEHIIRKQVLNHSDILSVRNHVHTPESTTTPSIPDASTHSQSQGVQNATVHAANTRNADQKVHLNTHQRPSKTTVVYNPRTFYSFPLRHQRL